MSFIGYKKPFSFLFFLLLFFNLIAAPFLINAQEQVDYQPMWEALVMQTNLRRAQDITNRNVLITILGCSALFLLIQLGLSKAHKEIIRAKNDEIQNLKNQVKDLQNQLLIRTDSGTKGICKKCGHQYDVPTKFCIMCGSNLLE